MKQRIVLFVTVLSMLLLAVSGIQPTRPTSNQHSQLSISSASAAEAPTLAAVEWPALALGEPISGFNKPVSITHAGDGSGRLFVVEQEGTIRIVENGAVLATPFLDITEKILCCGERGLLSVAFPRDYADNGFFYVYYTAQPDGNTVVARYGVTPNPNEADPGSETILLTVEQPYENHNGGQMVFGPDGYLYIGLGDGGSAGDPENRAQDTTTFLGKILRIAVDPYLDEYTIPESNPYYQTDGYLGEIWAYGLRNPWRFSFDLQTGDLYIADVGQGEYEEIDYQPASSSGGENYGWNCMEGNHEYKMTDACRAQTLVAPIHEYSHAEGGCSITGGYVYRGATYANMQGIYFYGDYCSAKIWGLQRDGDTWQNQLLLTPTELGNSLTSFGQDEQGELYVTDYIDGNIYPLISTGKPGETYGVAIEPDSPAKSGSANTTVTYTLQITNTGSTADTFDLAISGNEWQTTLKESSIGPLESGASTTTELYVTMPADGVPGDSDITTITATSQGNPTEQAKTTLTTLFSDAPADTYGVSITPATDTKSGTAGTTVIYTLTLTNNGSTADTFDLAISGNTWQTTLQASSIGPLESGASTTIEVSVTLPASGTDGDTDTATLTATSQGDPTRQAQASLTTVFSAATGDTYGITIDPSQPSQSAGASATVTYTLQLTNIGTQPDTFDLTFKGNAWQTTLETSTIGPLESGASASVQVYVRTPDTGAAGDSDITTLTATSQGDPTQQAKSILTTIFNEDTGSNIGDDLEEENPEVVHFIDQTRTSEPGSQAVYSLSITNTQRMNITFVVGGEGNVWDVTVERVWDNSHSLTAVDPIELPLNPGEQVNVLARVNVPATAQSGETDTVTITIAEKDSETDQQAEFELTTTAGTIYPLFIPLVNR